MVASSEQGRRDHRRGGISVVSCKENRKSVTEVHDDAYNACSGGRRRRRRFRLGRVHFPLFLIFNNCFSLSQFLTP